MMQEEFTAYNKLVQRYKKAEKYLDNNSIPIPDREKHIPEFQKIIKAMDSLMKQLKSTGYEMTSHEILNGFKEA